MEKEELIYTTPNNSKLRISLSIIFIILTWVAASSILYYAAIGQLKLPKDNPLVYWFIAIFFALVVAFSSILVAQAVLYSRFNIYANGITEPISPVHIFTKEGKLTHYNGMNAFQRYGRNNLRIIIYFDQNKRIAYSHKRDVIDTLEENLKKHKVKEMLETCPNCDSKLYGYTDICPQCKGRIFQNNHQVQSRH